MGWTTWDLVCCAAAGMVVGGGIMALTGSWFLYGEAQQVERLRQANRLLRGQLRQARK